MFEDINHSGDGGLYGELLTNRGLEGSNIDWGTVSDFPYNTIVGQENECLAGGLLAIHMFLFTFSSLTQLGPVITGYKPSGNTSLRLDTLRPLSVSHQWTLAVDIPLSANKSAERPGLQNMGWWGIPVSPQTYNVSFFIYPDQVRNQYNLNTSITVSLQSNVTGEVFASTVIPAQPWNVVNWTHVETQIHCNVSAPDVNNTLAITFDPLEANGQTYYFSIISLFGETFKDIPNGLRKDLAQHIYDLKPKFLRWPGGNNLEGYSIQRRWKWWETVGPLRERWSRPGNWNYWNTNGLGLMEFFSWAESMEMENVLGIYSGYSLANGMGENAAQFPSTEEAMYPVLREALDELEFCLGATDTYWGSKRAEFGHPEPYVVNYVEIGNEDWFSSNYPFRFDYLYKHLKAAYPHITFIASAYNEMAGHTVDLPPGSMWDTHHYEEPQFFIDSFDFWDNWQAATNNTDVGVKIGEYSVIQVQTPSGEVDWSFPPALHIQYPRLVSALAEGVYLLGAERNPDVVRMTCYAPSLQNWNWYNWTPNLVAFDADPASTVLSTSYYLQKLFGAFHGTESLSVANGEGDFGPLYWAASVEGEDKVYLKVM